jgi:hypothetical protein
MGSGFGVEARRRQVRLFWAAEGGLETADPARTRISPLTTPLWNILGWTPGDAGRAGTEAD